MWKWMASITPFSAPSTSRASKRYCAASSMRRSTEDKGERTMEKRSLGNTGLSVSAIGLGCAGMSEGYGTPSDEQSWQTLSAALESGVNFFDTADAYGIGHNEELIGRFVADRRNRVVLATKFGLVRK